MLVYSFFEGIITALGALILELTIIILFNLTPAENSSLTLFVCVVIEEILKYIIIFNRYLKLTSKKNIYLNAFFIGLGFSLTELFLKQIELQKIFTLSILGIIFIHILTASLVGFFFFKNYHQKKIFIPLLLIFIIILHFCYNFLVLQYK